MARLHVIECGIQSGIQCQIKLLRGVIGQSNAGSGGLCIVDQHVDSAEFFHSLVHYILNRRLIIGTGTDIGLNRKHLDAVQSFQLFLGCLQLFHISAGDNQVRPFLRICGCNSISNRAAASVTECGAAASRNNRCFSN